ncbi:unnamed protein product [Symbiodinium sp. CCMP2592]|nr:unnamed protein product [Symbiodinium sp. CCMP2592]
MLKHIIKYMQVNFIRSSLCVCTIFCWRSFKWHSHTAAEGVKDQKTCNHEKLIKRQDDPGFGRALQVLEALKSQKPWKSFFADEIDHDKKPPNKASEMLQSFVSECSTREPNSPAQGFNQRSTSQNFGEPKDDTPQPQQAAQDAGWSRVNLTIVALSTLGLGSGVFLMSVGPELEARNKLFQNRDEPTFEAFSLSWWWINMLGSLVLMCDGWARLLLSLLNATDKFRNNITQVLIFSCPGRLTSWSHLSRGLEAYSYRNRCRAKRLLQTYAREAEINRLSSGDVHQMLFNNASQSGPPSRMFPWWRVAPALTCGDAKLFHELLRQDSCQLSFAHEDDLQAWWLLRQYVHIDLADEASQMEFVGVMVATFLAVFGAFLSLDLLLKYSLISQALVIMYLSSSPFLLLMLRVFSYGIDINSLLVRDAQVLSDAATWARFFPDEMWVREEADKVPSWNDATNLTLQLDLSTLQRNTEVHEHIQTLLGVRVTSNLLAGWIVSVLVTGVTWLQGLAAQVWSIEWLAQQIKELEFTVEFHW